MAASWNNFVQSKTTTQTLQASSTMDIAAAIAPWTTPPDPAGGIAWATITDSLSAPTKFEVVSYTGRTGTGPYTITGMTRGLEGTIAQVWPADSFVIQYITADKLVDEHSLASQDGDTIIDGGTF